MKAFADDRGDAELPLLCSAFGAPEEAACRLSGQENIKDIRQKMKQYDLLRMILVILAVFAVTCCTPVISEGVYAPHYVIHG